LRLSKLLPLLLVLKEATVEDVDVVMENQNRLLDLEVHKEQVEEVEEQHQVVETVVDQKEERK